MGKYLIKSSESKYKKFWEKSSSKFFIDNLKEKEEESEKFEITNRNDDKFFDDSGIIIRTYGSEGGRWNFKIKAQEEEEEEEYKKKKSNNSLEKTKRKIVDSNKSFKLIRSFTITLVLLAIMFFGITIASPTPSLNNLDKNIENRLEEYNDNFSNEDSNDFENRDDIDYRELDKIRETIMQDLGLTRIPDPSKANVSQTEYEKAHREYLKRVELSKGEDQRTKRRLHVFYPADPVSELNSSRGNVIGDSSPSSSSSSYLIKNEKSSHSIYFPVEIPPENHAIDHATLRILIGHDYNFEYDAEDDQLQDYVEVSIYQRTKTNLKPLIKNQRVSIAPFSPRWADFDSTEAVSSWYHDGEENLGFQIEVKRDGVPVRWKDPHLSALNVFTISDNLPASSSSGYRNRRATPDQLMSLHRGRRTECKGQNKKCCRHQMTVIFKDLKGFEFIIQPKDFDAGYCKGRCPPRYNPAHHHALLQSLIWQEDRKKAPRPCCAPSKLTELEILYFDEKDPTKLKVSNWKNMKVLECACS